MIFLKVFCCKRHFVKPEKKFPSVNDFKLSVDLNNNSSKKFSPRPLEKKICIHDDCDASRQKMANSAGL